MSNSIYNNQNIVQTVSANCGQGKTHSAIKYAISILNQQNILFTVPTKELAEQVKRMFVKQSVSADNIVIINRDYTERVTGDIVKTIKNAPVKGLVLIITFEAYKRISYFHKRDRNWLIIIDEVPQPDQVYEFEDEDIDILLDLVKFDVSGYEHNRLKRVFSADDKAIADKIKNIKSNSEATDNDKTLEAFLYELIDDNKHVLVDLDSMDSDTNTVHFISIIAPSLLKGAILLGAMIEQSFLYLIYKNMYPLTFLEHTEILNNLRPATTGNKNDCINYIIDGRNYSKWFRNKKKMVNGVESCVSDIIHNQFAEEVQDKDFLFITNKIIDHDIQKLPGCTQISTHNRGLNEYDHYANIVYTASLNRSPAHIEMLKKIGLNSDQIRTASNYEILYQSVLRTRLRWRERTFDENVNVYCVTRNEAEFLNDILGGDCTINKLSLPIDLDKRVPKSQVDRNRTSKDKKLLESLNEYSSHPHILVTNPLIKDTIMKNVTNKWETSITNLPATNTSKGFLLMSIYRDLKSDTDTIIHEFTITKLVSIMRQLSKTKDHEKGKKGWVSTAIYSDKNERNLTSHVGNSGIILDFDSGQLLPDKFSELLGKVSHMTFNSFSNAPNNLRYRVMIPFTQLATADQYRAVYDWILNDILKDIDNHGLDKSSKNVVQGYYLPGTNINYPESAFFESYYCHTREFKLYGLDPTRFELPVVINNTNNTNVIALVNYDQKVQAAIDVYLAVPKGNGKRNHAFYELGLSLLHYKSITEIERILFQVANGEQKFIGRIKNNIKAYEQKNSSREHYEKAA